MKTEKCNYQEATPAQALGDLTAQWTSVLVIECEYMEHNYG